MLMVIFLCGTQKDNFFEELLYNGSSKCHRVLKIGPWVSVLSQLSTVFLYFISPLRCQWTSPPSRRRRGKSGCGKENRRGQRNRNWMILRMISKLMITANFGRRNKWTDAVKCLIESIYVVSHVQYCNFVLYVTLQLKSLEMFVVILTFYLGLICIIYFYS